MDVHAPHASTTELDRLGDEIAELSVHLDAASARLLDLIRDFDTRGGWNNGFRSCAECPAEDGTVMIRGRLAQEAGRSC